MIKPIKNVFKHFRSEYLYRMIEVPEMIEIGGCLIHEDG